MDNAVFDPLRRKYVALTPEEQVRQYFIAWLNNERNYPLALMASEYSIKYGRKSLRCDIVVFNRNLQPQIIVECKAPGTALNANVASQIMAYAKVLEVPYLIVTNGNVTLAYELNREKGNYGFIGDIPHYNSNL